MTSSPTFTGTSAWTSEQAISVETFDAVTDAEPTWDALRFGDGTSRRAELGDVDRPERRDRVRHRGGAIIAEDVANVAS